MTLHQIVHTDLSEQCPSASADLLLSTWTLGERSNGLNSTMASMSVDLVNKAPPGTKLWLLNCGFLEAEEGWFKRGGGVSTKSDPKKAPERRKMVVISVLIEHPTEGLILFETGSGKDFPNVWGAPLNDIFAQVDYNEEQELDKQIELAGHSIKDVKMVIMGHLHLDHAGGLQYFIGTGESNPQQQSVFSELGFCPNIGSVVRPGNTHDRCSNLRS